jgi:hypothetical protein
MFKANKIEPMPRMAEMLKMFEPNAFPMDKGAPPENAALKATVNSAELLIERLT